MEPRYRSFPTIKRRDRISLAFKNDDTDAFLRLKSKYTDAFLRLKTDDTCAFLHLVNHDTESQLR